MALVKLHHKEFEGLVFGPDSEIKFGLRGGFEPGYCVIDDEHPLYDELWRAEGHALEIVDADGGPPKVYVSPIDPAKEFKTKAGLLAHIRKAAKDGNAMAKLWLEENAKGDEPEA